MSTELVSPAAGAVPARPTLPFRVSRVLLQNYKSISFCDVSLEPLTLLVGRNGAGKSNFLGAFAFVRALVSEGLSEAITQRGGKTGVFHQGCNPPRIVVELDAELLGSDGSIRLATWRVEIDQVVPRRRTDIVRESLRVRDAGGECGYEADLDGVRYFGLSERETHDELDRMFVNATVLRLVSSPRLRWVTERLGAMYVYNFSPEGIRGTTRLGSEEVLMGDGRNLGDVLLALKAGDPSRFGRLVRYLRRVVPELQSVDPQRYGGNLFEIEFVFGPDGVPEKRFDAARMSDGTLRALASLAAVFQVGSGAEAAPALVGIEEPETSLHPAALHSLLAALDAATADTQVLLTTHNADWLGEAPIHLDQIRVVRLDHGTTVVAPVDGASRSIVADRLDTLAELQRQNQLEPDPADLARQVGLRERRDR